MNTAFLYYRLLFWLTGFMGSVFMIFGPLYLQQQGKGAMIGLFFSVSALSGFISMNLWGRVFDRFPRVLYFVLTGLVSDLLLFGYILNTRTSGAVFDGFVLSLLLQAYFPAVQAAVTVMFPEKGKALGKLFMFESAGWGSGALCGVIVFAAGGDIFLLFKMCLILCLIFLLFSFAAPFSRMHYIPEDKPGFLTQFRLLQKKSIRSYSMKLFWLCIGNSMFFSFFGVYFTKITGSGETVVGLSMILATIFGAISYPFYGKAGDHRGSSFLLNLAFIGYTGCFLLMIPLHTAVFLILFYAVPFYPGLRISGNLFISSNTAVEERGAGIGLIESLHSLGMMIAPLISGFFVGKWGIEYLPHITVSFFLLYIPLFVRKSRSTSD